jgi:hypothetical protein
LVELLTSAPTTHPTQFPSAQLVDVLPLAMSPTSAPTTYPTQLPSVQPVDVSSALSAPSLPPTPQIRSTQLPSAQAVDASSALSSLTTFRFGSGGKRYNSFRPFD